MLSPQQATARARQLRKGAPDAENRLWYVLRNRNLAGRKFVRQFAIDPYIADFACREAALVIELDGGQHADSASDARRTAHLNREGYTVLRFWNNEVMSNRDGVVLAILSVIEDAPLPGLRLWPAIPHSSGPAARGMRASDGANAERTRADGEPRP